jgi:hypothetical protein
MASQSLKDICKWSKTNTYFSHKVNDLKGFLRLPEEEILAHTGHQSKKALIDAYARYFLQKLYMVPTLAPSQDDVDVVKQWIVDRLSPKDKTQ